MIGESRGVGEEQRKGQEQMGQKDPHNSGSSEEEQALVINHIFLYFNKHLLVPLLFHHIKGKVIASVGTAKVNKAEFFLLGIIIY